jgi:polyisoprenoid-binding protein YceI
VAPSGSLAGTWAVIGGSSAGYGITLTVPFLGTSQVTGQTQAMTGDVRIENVAGVDRIASAHFRADLRQLHSGNSLLDRQVNLLLQTEQYPNSDFDLLYQVDLPPAATLGTPQPIILPGQLTLQGQTRPFTVPATVQLVNDQLVIAAGVDFKLSEFGVSTVVGGVATVDDAARFEFHLVLTRST